MHSTDTQQGHDTEPPIETGTSWGVKVLGLFYAIPVSAAIGAFPGGWLLVFCYLDKKGLADINISVTIICSLVAVNLLTATVGIALFRSGLGVFLQRIRLDEEGLHVWELKWRHFPWSKLSSHNFVTFHSKNGSEHGFVPHTPGEDPATPIRGITVFLRAFLSPASFSFNALPRKVREDILRRIQARLPNSAPQILPDVIRFRIGECPFRKRIIVDRGGVSIGSWGRERRYAWDNVEEMVIRRSSPMQLSFDRLYIRFTDAKELGFMQVSRLSWGEEQPSKEVIAGILLRNVPDDRIIEITQGIPLTVKALDFEMNAALNGGRTFIHYALYSVVIFAGLLGIALAYQHFIGETIPLVELRRQAGGIFAPLLLNVVVLGGLGFHGTFFQARRAKRRLREARGREQMEEEKGRVSH